MNQTVRNWLASGKYLPPRMRDFHAQKDIFKALFDACDVKGSLTWVDAHIFTVDFFLWWMAAHGWTLQRSRRRLPFSDLDAAIRVYDEKCAATLMAGLSKGKYPSVDTASA